MIALDLEALAIFYHPSIKNVFYSLFMFIESQSAKNLDVVLCTISAKQVSVITTENVFLRTG